MSDVIGLPERRRRQRTLSRLLLIVGFLLAATAAAGAYVFISGQLPQPPPPPPPTVAVLVAAGSIDVRSTVGTGDVMVVQMDPALVPVGALREPALAVGKIATVAMVRNEPILPSKFTVASGTPFSVFPESITLAPGAPEYRAVSINVGDANAVGGNVQPGDVVDLVYSLTYELRPGSIPVVPPSSTATTTEHAARIVFERVPILARTGSIYTLRLDAASAERLVVLQTSEAQVSFLLRAPKDDRSTKAPGNTLTNETVPFLRIPGVVR